MQSYLLKNSLRSTLLLLLRVAEAEKVIDLYLIDWLIFTIAGVWYLYPEPKTNPIRVQLNTIFGIMKTFLI